MLNSKVTHVVLPLILLIILTFNILPAVSPSSTHSAFNKLSEGVAASMQLNSEVNVLIETSTSDYCALKALIEGVGGRVYNEYKYVNAISASIPAGSIPKLLESTDVVRIVKDAMRHLASVATVNMEEIDKLMKMPVALQRQYTGFPVSPAKLSELSPNTYWNPVITQADPLWSEGYYGDNSLVAIIDTGIWTGHFMFQYTKFLGGIDLSFDNSSVCDEFNYYPPWYSNTTFLGWDNPNNYWHGSHVAGILAGSGAILLPENDSLALAIEKYSGMELPSGEPYGYPGYKILYLFGIAPGATLYIVKVFDHTGAGIPESLVLKAIEHVVDLKMSGVDVDVISMSLGGPTLYDGRDMEDRLVDYATSVGITVVAAAGNDGPAEMTVSSPGSANTAITVGAAADPVHTRVFWDYYYDYPGIGYYLYKTNETQIIYFNSRGPTSDGRLKPTVSATGVFVLSAYPTGGVQSLAFASGTSMSTPAVSGAVALLNDYSEKVNGVDVASPQDYREALMNGATPLPGYVDYDQGAGYLNVYASWIALQKDTLLGELAPELPPEGTLADISNIPIVGEGIYDASIQNLAPGHKVDFIFKATHLTGEITLVIYDVYLGEQNPLGINSFEVYIQGAKRTCYDYFIDSANVYGSAWFTITDDSTSWGGHVYGVYSQSHVIEPGYWKIVVENDWTSYDLLSCKIKIIVTPLPKIMPYYVFTGNVSEGSSVGWIEIPIPKGTAKVDLRLYWQNDWSKYPTSDLDMYVYWDEGLNYEGATLNSPERVVLTRPTYVYVLIYGFTVYTETEPFVFIAGFKLPCYFLNEVVAR